MKAFYQIFNRLKNQINDQQGVTAVVIAIALIMLLSIVALAVDIGYLFTTKNELQNIADAAALAGAGKLGDNLVNSLSNPDCDSVIDAAIAAAEANKATGTFFEIDDTPYTSPQNNPDIKVGFWDSETHTFNDDVDCSSSSPNAVKVSARKNEASASGPISMFFARIFGFQTANAAADAVAALTGTGSIEEMELPVGLSEHLFDMTGDTTACNKTIDFTQTQISCAGWHNFEDPINANAMKNKLLGLIINDNCNEGWCPDGYNDDPDGDGVFTCEDGDCSDTECRGGFPCTFNELVGEYWWNKYYDDDDDNGISDFDDPDPAIEDEFGEGDGDLDNDGDGALDNPSGDPPDDLPEYDVPDPAEIPGGELNDEFEFQGGVIGALFTGSGNIPPPIVALFDYYKMHDIDGKDTGTDGLADKFDETKIPYLDEADNNALVVENGEYGRIYDPNTVWTAAVPVYNDTGEDANSCMNPNTNLEIVGFAFVHVLNINTQPENTFDVFFNSCKMIPIEGRGAGGTSGNISGYIPNLVE